MNYVEVLCHISVVFAAFKTLQQGDVSKVIPIYKLSVIFTVFLSFIILKESVSRKVVLGRLFIIGGSLIIQMEKQ